MLEEEGSDEIIAMRVERLVEPEATLVMMLVETIVDGELDEADDDDDAADEVGKDV